MIPCDEISGMLLPAPQVYLAHVLKDIPGVGHVRVNDRQSIIPLFKIHPLFADHIYQCPNTS